MAQISEEVWKWLWTYRAWLVRIARSDFQNILHSDENAACDLADDVLFRAGAKIQTLRDRRSVKPWLRTILKRAALDLARGRQSEGQGFASWLRAANEEEAGNDSFRCFAFLSLLEVNATKAEKKYLRALKKDAAASRVVNIPKNRAVQLLKRRFHAGGEKAAAIQAKMARQIYHEMVAAEQVAKEITANIATLFRRMVRSSTAPDDIVWGWCCALVIAAMREGLAEANADKSVLPAVRALVKDVWTFTLTSVLTDATADVINEAKRVGQLSKKTRKKRAKPQTVSRCVANCVNCVPVRR